MQLSIEEMTRDDWDRVRSIYLEGIAMWAGRRKVLADKTDRGIGETSSWSNAAAPLPEPEISFMRDDTISPSGCVWKVAGLDNRRCNR